jgi:colicin import membrane protein
MDEPQSVRASDTRSISGPQWLTYAEAAQRFGISSEAVRQIALRRKWPRRRPNDDPFGRVQVQIPQDEDVRPRTTVQRPDEHPTERPSDTRSTAELNTLLEQVDKAEARAERAEARADRAEVRADAADADRRAAEARADRAEQGISAERARGDLLQEQVQGLLTQLATLEADGKAVNDRAWAAGEAAGALREQVARLELHIETERARADRAEASAAHERQDFLDAESRTRRELDEIRQRLEQAEESREAAAQMQREAEAAQIKQAEAAAELRDQLDQTRAQAEAALQEAVALKAAAETAGRAGRWARLRRAWRGE